MMLMSIMSYSIELLSIAVGINEQYERRVQLWTYCVVFCTFILICTVL